jgi:hypothetical protein
MAGLVDDRCANQRYLGDVRLPHFCGGRDENDGRSGKVGQLSAEILAARELRRSQAIGARRYRAIVASRSCQDIRMK